MSINYEQFRQLSALERPRPQGIEALVKSIHRAPELRDWVTLESQCLVPIPRYFQGRWQLVALLAVPRQPNDGRSAGLLPWGAVIWNWPEQTVAETLDLRTVEAFQVLRSLAEPVAKAPAKAPSQSSSIAQAAEKSQRLQALYVALAEVLEASTVVTSTQLQALAQHYAGLLPSDFYPYYHALVPNSQAWLKASIPAVKLEFLEYPASDVTGAGQAAAHLTTVAKLEDDRAPAQLSNQAQAEPLDLQPWLNQAQTLAQGYEMHSALPALASLAQRQSLPGFRLAVVGEFSRGKSSLINRLLGEALLPTGAAPSTAALTSVLAGETERLQIQWPDGREEARSLSPQAWTDLVASSNNSAAAAQANLRITTPHLWLNGLDLELIDTPGAGDLSGEQAARVTDILSQCDGALMVVSATLPFSLTEQSFLELEVLGQHVPKVFVVVSKLDTVEMAERLTVFRTIRDRIHQISPYLTVLPGHALTESESDEVALNTIHQRIEVLVGQGDRAHWRSQQMALQLSDQLGQMVVYGQEQQRLVKLSEAERRDALEQALSQQKATKLAWQQLTLELEQRRIALERSLKERIFSGQRELYELLAYDLSRAPEPKAWWERDLPFRIRRDLATMGKQTEGALVGAIAQDFAWLQETVNQRFGQTLEQGGMPGTTSDAASLDGLVTLEAQELRDTKTYRMLTRMGCGGAAIAGYVLGGPIGIAASTGIWVLGERVISDTVKKQRQQLSQDLERSLQEAFDCYFREVCQRVRQVYAQLVEGLQQESTSHQAAQLAALKQSSTEDAPQTDWSQLIEQVQQLQGEIQQHCSAFEIRREAQLA